MMTASALFAAAALLFAQQAELARPPRPIVFNDDGAWCWFQDERALISDSQLIVGSVASGRHDSGRSGNVEVASYDLHSGALKRFALHERLELDDHAAPAFWQRPDGRLIAVYSKHGPENRFYVRQMEKSGDVTEWTPAASIVPTERSRITYSNLLFLGQENGGRGRLYNFFRGLDASFKPSYAWSDDFGETWNTGNVVIDVPLKFRHRPYVKYVSNHRDRLHLLYTDGHPRDFDNNVYHVAYRGGLLVKSDGAPIGPLAGGLKAPEEGTRVFTGDPQSVAWVSDLHLSREGWPYAVFTVQKDSAGLKSGDPEAGQDHRYYYAAWDGMAWHCHQIAYAGSRLYKGEDDYTGNICLDPDRPGIVYFSTNADPVTGRPLISRADNQRHYELFRGTSDDGGMSWSFAPLTENSTQDNLRPIVPAWDGKRACVLWFRGQYRTYRDYDTEIVGLLLDNLP